MKRPSNRELMAAIGERGLLEEHKQRLVEALVSFKAKWDGVIPRNPVDYLGVVSTTLLDLRDGTNHLFVSFGDQAFAYEISVVGGVIENNGQLAIRDKRGTVRTLVSMGVLPNDGEWPDDHFTVIDSPDALTGAIQFLIGLGTEPSLKAAEIIVKHSEEKHGATFAVLTVVDSRFMEDDSP